MTCKEEIIKYLTGNPSGIAGGSIERDVSDLAGHKPSTVGRVLRDMYNPGKLLQRRYSQRKPHFVIYRLI